MGDGQQEQPVFAHPAEAKFARILDFYRLEWEYEPRTFPLEWDEEGNVTAAFTPDFYIPSQDLYIEITTIRPKLSTFKNRKLRRLQELYPEINVKLFKRRDVRKLMVKYGLDGEAAHIMGTEAQEERGEEERSVIGYPLEQYGELAEGIQRVIITREEIETRIYELGEAISRDYAGKNPLLVGVLKGVVPFMADLVRAITIPIEVDYMDIARFQAGGSGPVRLQKDLNVPIEGRHVLFVEDVIDTGMTLNYLLRNLRAREPASLEVCVFFNKPVHRLVDIPLTYKGFDLPDKFVVGYGLDYREQYRNLPFVGLLHAHVFQEVESRE